MPDPVCDYSMEYALKGSRVEQEDQMGVTVVAQYEMGNGSEGEESWFNSE